jgi:hypothetical protein
MHHMDFDEMADIGIKGGHEKVYVMKIVELPAFGDQRVAQDVLESDCVLVHLWWQVAYSGETEGGLGELRQYCRLSIGLLGLHRRCQPTLLQGRADRV